MRHAIGLVLLLGLAGCDGEPSPGPSASSEPATNPATAPATRQAISEQVEYARRPISYFNDNCGKCHGNYGTYWLEGVLVGLGERKLREEVELMAAGPAQAPLEGLALEVQVAYHRSLIDGRPFVTVFRHEGGLAGEVTPGSRVLLISGGREQEAAVEQHRWKSSLRDATAVRVLREGAATDLPLEALGLKDQEGAVSGVGVAGVVGVVHSHARPAE